MQNPFAFAHARRSVSVWLALCGVALSACSDGAPAPVERAQSARSALTKAQTDILGFETLSDWNVSQGTKSLSAIHSQGQKSLAVVAGGWTEIESIALTSLGSSPSTASVDVRLPRNQTNPWWYGSLQLYVSIPSQNLNDALIGQAELTGKPLEQLVPLTFQVPPEVKTALGKSYADLRVKVALNVPTGNGAYLLDNLQLGQAALTQGTRACDPYQQVGLNGDVRFQLTTLSSDKMVRLKAKLNGNIYLDRLLSPSNSSDQGTSTYTFIDEAARYHAGDVITSQLSFDRAGVSACPVTTTSPWSVGAAYALGARVSYQGQLYEARQAHTAQADWTPTSNTLALWQIPNDCRVAGWLASTAYKVGDVVAFAGQSYQALQAHTSQSDWPPSQVPALWQPTPLAPNPPSGTGTVTLYKPGPTESDWTEQIYAVNGGCTSVPDRDGDGVSDNQDLCPDDPWKQKELGACGCNVVETDSDGDHTPDCIDHCPQDKPQVEPGDCGCASQPAPLGQFCDDGGAPGPASCDGAGHCGPVNGGRPSFAKGQCITVERGDSIYVSCPTDRVSWNDAAKLAPSGYQLARIDDKAENKLVASLLAGAGSPSSWLDGTTTGAGVIKHTVDGTATDEVMWDEQQAPKNVGLRYFNWQPTPGAGSGCQSLLANGSWQLASCGELRAVVYERSSRTLTVRTSPTPITAADFPGLVSVPNHEPGSEPCVDHAALYDACRECLAQHTSDPPEATDPEAPNAPPPLCADACAVSRCYVCLEGIGEQGDPEACSTSCTTCEVCQAKQAKDSSLNCDSQCSEVGTTSCASPFGAVCEVNVANPASPVDCVRQACPAGDPDCQPQYTCPAGLTCGLLKACDCGPDKACKEECPKLACGTLANPKCGLDASGPSTCREELACSAGPEVAQTGELKDEMKPLTVPVEPTVADAPPHELPIKSDPFPSADDEGQASSVAEAACHYTTQGPDKQPKFSDGKRGAAGKKDNKALQFDLDPNVTLDYHLDALPLGQIDFSINAAASLKATATVNFAGINQELDVLDAALVASVDRCGYTMASSHLDLFSKDFLPPLLDEAKLGDLLKPHQVPGCEDALKAYQEVADRVKKAMRDAQELLRQYHDALDGRACLPTPKVLCHQLLDDAPPGFVGIDCDTTAELKVENLINLFIFNYERLLLGSFDMPPLPDSPKFKLPDFPDVRLPNPNFGATNAANFGDLYKLGTLPSLSEAGKVLSGLKPDTGRLDPHWDDTYGCGAGAKTKLSTLFTKPFMLGPIPMLLEVQSVVKYGLGGDLNFAFHPEELVALATGDKSASVTVASVTANATPCVSAGLGLFVGAGFKGYGFRATAGVQGVVNLGTISAPADATAYVKMSAEDEAVGLTGRPSIKSGDNNAVTSFRELPKDLKGLWDGKDLPIKLRRFNVALGYNYGLSVGINQILAGYLKAELQIKFLFFKKRWSKYLVNFGNGFSLGTYRLIGGKGDVALQAEVPWAKLQMPTPFVNFRYLDPLPEGVIGASADQLPSFDIPVAQLGALGWDSPRFDGITLPKQALVELGGLAGDLQAQGIDLATLTLADLSSLGITLDRLSGVPLTLEDLVALNLSASDLATLGIELPVLASDGLKLAGLSLAHVGALDLPGERLAKVQVDWRDLPELSYRLRRPELAQLLRNAGVELANLTLPDFFKLNGLTIDSFRAWPLTPEHVKALALTTAELKKMGVDLTGFDLTLDGDLESLLGRGLDLSGLSLASLSKLGLDLSKLGAIPVDTERLGQLNQALGYSNILDALAAAGVTDLENVKLSDLGKLKAGLDGIKSTLSSKSLGLLASDLVKLGLGNELSSLTLPNKCTPRELTTDRVGKFFYEHQCQCRAPFNREKPFGQGQQSCSSDADCCQAAPHCNSTLEPGYKVCAEVASSECGPVQTIVVPVPDAAKDVDFQGEYLTQLLEHDFGRTICSVPQVFLENRAGSVGYFDDLGEVRFPRADRAGTQITNDPDCLNHVLGSVKGPIDISGFVEHAGSRLGVELIAGDVCGSNVGWHDLQLRYQVSFVQP